MRYGTSEPFTEQRPDLEPDAANRCIRAAWAAGYQVISSPTATWSQVDDCWRLVTAVVVEARAEEQATDENDMGFA